MTKTLADIAQDMAGIDIAILSTHTENGEIANRPMSNNGDVAYDGTSYYFSYPFDGSSAIVEPVQSRSFKRPIWRCGL